MIQFDFNTSSRIIFGSGSTIALGKTAKEFGDTALFVTGPHVRVAAIARKQLESAGIKVIEFIREGEPTDRTIKEGMQLVKSDYFDLVVACGGGSSIDTGKAISALMTNPGELIDYLEIVGKGQPLGKLAAPFIAIPTTAGTGSEVTRNAVIRIERFGIKVSLRGINIVPRVAIIDPELTLQLPREITAYTGMDALTQLIEPYMTIKANPITDALCLEGINRSARSLKKAFFSGENLEFREDLCLASLFSGIALANSGLGAVHGIAGVIGGMIPVPHGEICARLLPYVLEMNANLLGQEGKDSVAYKKLLIVSKIILSSDFPDINGMIKYLEELLDALNIHKLRDIGIDDKEFPSITEQSLSSSSMKGNPVPLSEENIKRILEKAF